MPHRRCTWRWQHVMPMSAEKMSMLKNLLPNLKLFPVNIVTLFRVISFWIKFQLLLFFGYYLKVLKNNRLKPLSPYRFSLRARIIRTGPGFHTSQQHSCTGTVKCLRVFAEMQTVEEEPRTDQTWSPPHSNARDFLQQTRRRRHQVARILSRDLPGVNMPTIYTLCRNRCPFNSF